MRKTGQLRFLSFPSLEFPPMLARCFNAETEAGFESKEEEGVVGGRVEPEEIRPASASSVPPRFKGVGFNSC